MMSVVPWSYLCFWRLSCAKASERSLRSSESLGISFDALRNSFDPIILGRLLARVLIGEDQSLGIVTGVSTHAVCFDSSSLSSLQMSSR